jgi:hypothetical protein
MLTITSAIALNSKKFRGRKSLMNGISKLQRDGGNM